MMCVHMAGLMRDSVRPWGVSSSRSGEGFSVARAAISHSTTQYRQHPTQFMSETTNKRIAVDKHSTAHVYLMTIQDRTEGTTQQGHKLQRDTHHARDTLNHQQAHMFILNLYNCSCIRAHAVTLLLIQGMQGRVRRGTGSRRKAGLQIAIRHTYRFEHTHTHKHTQCKKAHTVQQTHSLSIT